MATPVGMVKMPSMRVPWIRVDPAELLAVRNRMIVNRADSASDDSENSHSSSEEELEVLCISYQFVKRILAINLEFFFFTLKVT